MVVSSAGIVSSVGAKGSNVAGCQAEVEAKVPGATEFGGV